MVKKSKLLVFLLILTLFSGCSLDSGIEKKLEKELEKDDQSYTDYITLKEQLDENGVYAPQELDENVAVHEGDIHITFANNPYLDITYFYDSKNEENVDQKHCFVNAGESIFTNNPLTINALSNKYKFIGFNVWSINDKNKKEEIIQKVQDEFEINIPSDFKGKEIQIEPLGKFEKRTIRLHDYYVDENGEEVATSGVWSTNEIRTVGEDLEVPSIKMFTLFYDYSDYVKEYYVANTEPEYFSNNNGMIEFFTDGKVTVLDEYEVELKPFIKIAVKNSNNVIQKVKLNGEDITGSLDRMNFLIPGDELEISIDKNYSISINPFQVGEPSIIGNTKKYSIIVQDSAIHNAQLKTMKQGSVTSNSFKQKIIPNGEVIVCHEGQTTPINEGDAIDGDTKVTMTISANKGYYLTGSGLKNGKYISTISYSKYLQEVDNYIKNHEIRKIYKINLDNQDEYGTVLYKLDDQPVRGEIKVKDGQVLSMYYTIKDNSYKITHINSPENSIWNSMFNRDTYSVVSIKINSSLDGETIYREKYIEVREQ